MSFSLQRSFTPLSVEDILSVLGDRASGSIAESSADCDNTDRDRPARQLAWQDAAQFVAANGHQVKKVNNTSGQQPEEAQRVQQRARGGPSRRSDAANPMKKRWKGKTKKKQRRGRSLGFDSLRADFPGTWFKGRAHRGPSKANGFPWDPEDCHDAYYSSEDDEWSSDEEVRLFPSCLSLAHNPECIWCNSRYSTYSLHSACCRWQAIQACVRHV